jgi:hypothetical protein
MRYRRLLVGAMLGAGVLSAPLASQAQNIVVQVAPPPPRHEVVPTMRNGYEWAPGYWNWNGRRYVWVAGHTVQARGPDYHWVAPQWNDEGGRYRFQAGRWEHGGHDSRDNGRNNGNDRRSDNDHRNDNNRDQRDGNQHFGDRSGHDTSPR